MVGGNIRVLAEILTVEANFRVNLKNKVPRVLILSEGMNQWQWSGKMKVFEKVSQWSWGLAETCW